MHSKIKVENLPTFHQIPNGDSSASQNETKKETFFSESVYSQTPGSISSLVRFGLQSIIDGLILTWNTVLVFLILVLMGFIQGFLSLSESKLTKSSSKILRIRRGKELIYKFIPTRLISRLWGLIHSWRIWIGFRPFFYRIYSAIYGVKIEEALEQNLYSYENLGEFFRRQINPACRPLARTNLVSPCDGKVLTIGRVKDGFLEQIKGQAFTVDQFLGPKIDQSEDEIFSYRSDDRDNRQRYCSSLLKDPEANELFYSVIYLAPGDYHRFHSPCDFKVTFRRHFPGALYSVNPSISCWLEDLFIVNERVSLYGEWVHGFFSYTAVGATMVGSIKLPWDQKLKTNEYNFYNRSGEFTQRNIQKTFQKGEEVGEFNLGSTIVLIFEAPSHYSFSVSENETVKLGQSFSMKMRKRHSMPNLNLGPTTNHKSKMKPSETFDSKKNLRHRFLQD